MLGWASKSCLKHYLIRFKTSSSLHHIYNRLSLIAQITTEFVEEPTHQLLEEACLVEAEANSAVRRKPIENTRNRLFSENETKMPDKFSSWENVGEFVWSALC